MSRKRGRMKRSSRIFVNSLNKEKERILRNFLRQCRDIIQFFVDFFWNHRAFLEKLAPKEVTDRAVERFGITVRLAQCLSKHAQGLVKSAISNKGSRPKVTKHTVNLFYHFVKIEKFYGKHFDWAIVLIGSGAPRIVIPLPSTSHLNKLLNENWEIQKSIRIGIKKNRIFIDFILEKEKPKQKTAGKVVGMDSNYKAGLVFSDRQQIGKEIYDLIQGFSKRQKNTYKEVKDQIRHHLKKINWKDIRVLCIEDLKNVKKGTRETFSRQFNRRLSHWIYSSANSKLEQICEEEGIQLQRKDPWKTSQCCSRCGKWERRNRSGSRFICVHCNFSEDADYNAAKNLEKLGLAGVYGLRWLENERVCQIWQSFS